MRKQPAPTSTPLSIEERLGRIDARVRLVVTALAHEAHEVLEDGDARVTGAVLTGVRQALFDTLENLDALQTLPYPVSEYRGERFEEWATAQLSRRSGSYWSGQADDGRALRRTERGQ